MKIEYKLLAGLVFSFLIFIAMAGTSAAGGTQRTGQPLPSPSETNPGATQSQALAAYGKLPLSFERNLGQTDPRVKFLTRGSGYTLFLTQTEAVLQFRNRQSPGGKHQSSVVRMKLVGANSSARLRGFDHFPGKTNYFIGADRKQWRSNIPHYGRVRQDGVYRGVDLVYYGNQRQLEYDFVVNPGADPNVIRLAFSGVDRLGLDSRGDLVLRVGGGDIHLRKPAVYQEIDGRREAVSGRYALLAAKNSGVHRGYPLVGFEIGAYDTTRPLVIDPVVYSTYLGGGGSDNGAAIAVDAAGNAYVTGWTLSTNFPTANPIQQNFGGGTVANDVFITKLNPAGTQAIYSTYLGGTGEDRGRSIAVDSSGSAYVTGDTASTNFPITTGAFRITNSGLADAFVVKLNPAGSALSYSTYLGSTGEEGGFGIVVHALGNATVTGRTNSTTFPTTPQAFRSTNAGGFDVFVSTLNSIGSILVYSTYLGGSAGDEGHAVATDSSSNAYVAGTTFSSNFPTTSGAFQTASAGFSDVFIAKLNAEGTSLLYSTYLGGGFSDEAFGLATDLSGNAYVTGRTLFSNFPTRNAFQSATGGFNDAFVTKINTTGTALEYSSYLGGSFNDEGFSIATDASGNAYLTGRTNSTGFPTTSGAVQTTLGGDNDVFVTKVSSSGSLAYSTFLGGSFVDEGYGIAVDFSGKAYVTGLTRSTNFPTLSPFQATHRGGSEDALVAKIDTGTSEVRMTLHFPRLVTSDSAAPVPDSSEYTGIAVANLGTTNGRLAFTAFDKTGTLITGTDITNPKLLDLKAGEQVPIVDTQVFGSGLAVRKPLGWFRVESTFTRLVGFFLMFNGSLSFLDGADVSSSTLTSFIFPEIEDQGFTQIHIANPSAEAASITLELMDSNGIMRLSASRTVNPNGAVAEFFADLFPGIEARGSDYIRVSSNRGVVPFEFLGKSGQYVEGLNGQNTTTGATTLYSPQYVVGGPDWRSTLSVVNLDSTAGDVTFEFIKDDGTLIGTRQAPIAARGKIFVTEQDFFINAGETLTQGYVKITSSGPKLAGSVVFGDPARSTFSSALPLVSQLRSSVVFSQVASNATYFTGIALLNPGDGNASALIEVFDEQGILVISKTEEIQAKRRKSQLLTQYFPTLEGRNLSSGYIRVTVNQNVAGFALFGTSGLSFLSAVPPQIVPP